MLALPCERPTNFDLAAYWKRSTAELERQRNLYEAVLVIESKAARRLLEWWICEPVTDGPSAPEGWLKLRIHFDSEEQARFLALGFGPAAQVVEPAALRDRVLAEARAVAAGVGNSSLPSSGVSMLS